MVKVAIAGGSGNVAMDVIDAILATNKHEVVILSRHEAPQNLSAKLGWATVDYNDVSSLVEALRTTDTVLSFLTGADKDGTFRTEKNLIDASIQAGVRRIAPSQWAARNYSGVHHYAFKDLVYEYLKKVNKPNKVIEYCLFQPGFFTNYFAYPHTTTEHFHASCMFADFEHCRAIVPEDLESPISLTTVEDMCRVVAEALDLPGEWPKVGGIRGSQTSVSELILLGEKLRGPFKVESPPLEDVKAGSFVTSWTPLMDHPSVPVDMRESISRAVLREYLLSLTTGAWSVTDEWNKLLPHIHLTSMEEYLSRVWTES